MPRHLLPLSVRLEFDGDALVHTNLSGAAFVGNDLWVAGDEACGLDRLTPLPRVAGETLRFGEPANFPLARYLDLPDAADIEADIEGLAYQDGYLWLIGSHGLKRKNPKPDKPIADNLKRLARLERDGNRCLLARVPVDEQDGRSVLARKTPDGRRAARLRGDTTANELTRALADDPHFAPFLAIPGKDNGLDIEGLALTGDTLLLGLRGPVLRGWSCLLELRLEEKKSELRLKPIGDSDQLYRKHFVRLDGLGIRDLLWEDGDLYLLAGPTMALDGAVRVYRWSHATEAFASLAPQTTAMLWESGPEQLQVLPHSPSTDRAEAITALPAGLAGDEPGWLVLYDAPGPARQADGQVVLADLLRAAAPEPQAPKSASRRRAK